MHRRSSCVALCRARIAHQPSRVTHMQFNSTHARGIIVHPTTMTTMTTTTVTTVRPMGWMRVVERRTSSIAHGDDHATKTTQRGAAQTDGRRTTDDSHDGRLTRRTTRTGATTDRTPLGGPLVWCSTRTVYAYTNMKQGFRTYTRKWGCRIEGGRRTDIWMRACVVRVRARDGCGWLARARARARGDGYMMDIANIRFVDRWATVRRQCGWTTTMGKTTDDEVALRARRSIYARRRLRYR